MTEQPNSGAYNPEVAAFWEVARRHAKLGEAPGELGVRPLQVIQSPAWSFGATPELADELLALVLAGTKTATAGSLWDYEAEDEPLPSVGALSILLDGADHPRALIVTTHVEVRPFDQVDEEHAYLEGEGDRTLRHWRDVHQWVFTNVASHDRGFAFDMPLVLERFKVLYKR